MHKRFNQLLHYRRRAFRHVMEVYCTAKLVVGSASAANYSANLGAQGSQYDRKEDPQFQLIDYMVDVENCIEYALGERAKRFIAEHVVDGGIDYSIQSHSFMHDQAEIGKIFVARKLYPVKKYFTIIKKKKEDNG